MKTIEMVPKRRTKLSAREFLALPEDVRKSLKRVHIQPPRLGESGFGKLVVEYRYPVFHSSHPPKKSTSSGAAR